MDITYLGHSSFKLRGKTATVVTDPFKAQLVGLKFPKVDADIVTISHQHEDHNATEAVSGTPVVIAGPGEYEVKGVRIIGVTSFHDSSQGSERGKNTIYHIKMDGISFVHCGDLGHKLDEKEIELLDGTDVLLLPVGGVYTTNPQEAAEVVSQLEPKIIIPMHYHTPKINQTNFGKLADVSAFLAEMGKENVTPVSKLNIIKDKLPTEPTVVVFE